MKRRLRKLLAEGRLDEVAELSRQKRRVLGLLTSLTFDPDPLVAWRGVEAMGRAAEAIAPDDPEAVRDHLRKLHWLISEESGGICWRAPEAMAEIVCRLPHQLADYVRLVIGLIDAMAEEDLHHFRPGILWAIGRLASVAPGECQAALPAVAPCLEHADPQVRGMAAWCLGQMGQRELLTGRPELSSDPGPVTIYRQGQLVETTVDQLVKEAIGQEDPGQR